jgi:hypothetical protein
MTAGNAGATLRLALTARLVGISLPAVSTPPDKPGVAPFDLIGDASRGQPDRAAPRERQRARVAGKSLAGRVFGEPSSIPKQIGPMFRTDRADIRSKELQAMSVSTEHAHRADLHLRGKGIRP